MNSTKWFCILLCTVVLAASLAADEAVNSEEIVEGLLGNQTKTRGIRVAPREHDRAQTSKSVVLQIQFQFGTANLNANAKTQLEELGSALTSIKLKEYRFEISGHTDSVGDENFNLLLSSERAESVKIYLVNHFDLDENSLSTIGHGETQLLMKNDPTNAVNRRVEIRAFH